MKMMTEVVYTFLYVSTTVVLIIKKGIAVERWSQSMRFLNKLNQSFQLVIYNYPKNVCKIIVRSLVHTLTDAVKGY